MEGERLEELLRQASAGPEMRVEFYREFLNSRVYILGKILSDPGAGGGNSFQLKLYDIDGQSIMPMFSGLERLRAVFGHEKDYLQVPVRELLQNVRGNLRMVLNPNSDNGKEFSPQEIKALLDGSALRPDFKLEGEEAKESCLGAARRRPEQALETLRHFLKSCPSVHKAYLAQKFAAEGPTQEGPAHWMVGLSFHAGVAPAFEEVLEDLSLAVQADLKNGDVIEFLPLEKGPVFKFFKKQIKAFYSQEWGIALWVWLTKKGRVKKFEKQR